MGKIIFEAVRSSPRGPIRRAQPSEHSNASFAMIMARKNELNGSKHVLNTWIELIQAQKNFPS